MGSLLGSLVAAGCAGRVRGWGTPNLPPIQFRLDYLEKLPPCLTSALGLQPGHSPCAHLRSESFGGCGRRKEESHSELGLWGPQPCQSLWGKLCCSHIHTYGDMKKNRLWVGFAQWISSLLLLSSAQKKDLQKCLNNEQVIWNPHFTVVQTWVPGIPACPTLFIDYNRVNVRRKNNLSVLSNQCREK